MNDEITAVPTDFERAKWRTELERRCDDRGNGQHCGQLLLRAFYSVCSERQLMEQLGYVGARTPDRESKAAREAASPERLTENARASGNSYLHGHRRVSGSRRQTEPFAAL
jgi:hypothetical protein